MNSVMGSRAYSKWIENIRRFDRRNAKPLCIFSKESAVIRVFFCASIELRTIKRVIHIFLVQCGQTRTEIHNIIVFLVCIWSELVFVDPILILLFMRANYCTNADDSRHHTYHRSSFTILYTKAAKIRLTKYVLGATWTTCDDTRIWSSSGCT